MHNTLNLQDLVDIRDVWLKLKLGKSTASS